ncbi:hypothetical protein VNO78_21290 [Psophocarpus tetragonolobus]|uniref:Uncharacterized protein n=1 Tax=Psophocarpus tetragonolobus TaxID=3891 RepID=A0AAN9SD05_PSOTE
MWIRRYCIAEVYFRLVCESCLESDGLWLWSFRVLETSADIKISFCEKHSIMDPVTTAQYYAPHSTEKQASDEAQGRK